MKIDKTKQKKNRQTDPVKYEKTGKQIKANRNKETKGSR